MKLHYYWAKNFNHSLMQQIFINAKCEASQKTWTLFSGTLPYSQVRQGMDTCHLTTVMIKATKNTVYDKGREANWGKEDIEDLK